MVTENSLLLEIGIIAGSALALSLVAWRLRLPPVLGQMIAGVLIGPFGLRLVTDLSTIQAVAEIGIVLLLFLIGLELDPFELNKIGVKVLLFVFIEISASFAGGYLAGLLLGWPIRDSLVLAGVVGVSSTALVAKLLYEQGALNQSHARLMMGALIVEDILAVLLLALLPNFASGSPPTVLDVALWIGRGALLIATLIIFGVYIAPRIIDRISQLEIDLDEAGFLLSLSLGFAMALLATLLGFSAGTGAFLMGLVIVGKRADFVYVKIRPVRDLFLVIFFVTMGILLDVSELLNIFAVLVVIATAFLAKYLGAYLGALLVGEKQRVSDVAIGMVPRGEFNLILAREASTFGVASTALYSLAGMTVLGTTLLSSLVQLVRQRRHRPR